MRPTSQAAAFWTLMKPRKPEAGVGAAGRGKARGITSSGRSEGLSDQSASIAPEMLREVPAQGISENWPPERSQVGLGPGLGALRPGAASSDSPHWFPVPESLAE